MINTIETGKKDYFFGDVLIATLTYEIFSTSLGKEKVLKGLELDGRNFNSKEKIEKLKTVIDIIVESLDYLQDSNFTVIKEEEDLPF